MPLLEQVLERYPKEVKLVYKSFPLNNHKFARKAAAAALAAGNQGRFWEFHNLLFENYNRINDEKITEIALQLDLDMERLLADARSPAVINSIDRDLLEGRNIGVRGTPAVFINGRLLNNRSLQGFAQMIDTELKKKQGN